MTIDEYAALEAAHGAGLVNVDGVWWRKTRPFFYQPLFPFLELVPHSKKPPRQAYPGGYKHLVPSEALANCRRHFLVWDDVRNYSIERVGHRNRNNIKKGIKHFAVKQIDDIEEFIISGHPIYLSFYARTKYDYKKERVEKKHFAEWARTLYRFPKVKITGAYYQGALSAIDISYLVENVLFAVSFFSKTEHLKYQVVDLMAHEMQEKAAACPNISLIFKGAITGNKGLDESKLRRGCTILSKPAFYQLHPFTDLFLRRCMNNSYQKISGSFEGGVSEEPEIEQKRSQATSDE